MFSERIYEKMYSGSRSKPALKRGVTQADESRRRGVLMEAIAGVDIAGCAFAPRCRYALDNCTHGEVPVAIPSAGMMVRCVRAGSATTTRGTNEVSA